MREVRTECTLDNIRSPQTCTSSFKGIGRAVSQEHEMGVSREVAPSFERDGQNPKKAELQTPVNVHAKYHGRQCSDG